MGGGAPYNGGPQSRHPIFKERAIVIVWPGAKTSSARVAVANPANSAWIVCAVSGPTPSNAKMPSSLVTTERFTSSAVSVTRTPGRTRPVESVTRPVRRPWSRLCPEAGQTIPIVTASARVRASAPDSTLLLGLGPDIVSDYLAALHHEFHALKFGDVRQRVA